MRKFFCSTGIVVVLAIAAGSVAWQSLASAPPVLAHANVQRSEPSPNAVLDDSPDRVIIWFTEPIEAAFSKIQVLDAQGRQIDNGDSTLDRNEPTALFVTLAPSDNGTFTVAWRNVSTVDGHLVRGSFIYSVGEPLTEPIQSGEATEQPLLQSPLEPVVRWLVLISSLAAVGGILFELLVVRPALAGQNMDGEVQEFDRRITSQNFSLSWLAMALLLLASCAQLLLQASVVHDISMVEAMGAPAGSILVDTEWGRLWLWRVGLLSVMAVLLGLAYAGREEGPAPVDSIRSLRPILWTLVVAAGAGILLTLSLVSHGAATTEVRSAAIFSDYLHLLAAALWVGGLFRLVMGFPLALSAGSAAGPRVAMGAMVPRFSTVAFLSVGTLVITGMFGTWAQVTVAQAVATPYGWSLVAKLGLVLPLLGLGAVNLLWIRPRLTSDGGARWFRMLVAGEALLALLVLLSVGMLTSLEPARQVASREGIGQANILSFQDTTEGTDISLEIQPGRVGPNSYLVSLKDRLGNPIPNATDVSLRLSYLDADLGEVAASSTAQGDGTYLLEEGLLNIAGPWQVELVVLRPDAFDARTAFRFEIGASISGSAGITPSAETGKLLWGIELALLGVLFLATGVPLGGWWTRRGAVIMGTGGISFMAALVLLFGSQSTGPGVGENLRNPFPPNPASLSTGKQVYAGNCLVCHGEAGRGDGPGALGLDPPPADLVVHVPLHPEQTLFGFIHDGIPGTGMEPLADRLSDEEIWHVINHIKTFE